MTSRLLKGHGKFQLLKCCLYKNAEYTSSKFSNLPPVSFAPTPYKGLSYDEVLKIRSQSYTNSIKLFYKKPLMITQGYMQHLWDENGKRYLDMFGGIVTVSVGHCHPRVTQSITDQLHKLWHVSNIYLYPALAEYAEKLVSRFPGDLKVCYFCNSGAEANDLATILARSYTGAFDIITLQNAYHGVSPTAMGLTAQGKFKQPVPHSFGIHNTMNPDPYTGLWGGSNCRDSPIQPDRSCSCGVNECSACDMYIQELEKILKYSTPNKIAGLFAESIQGVGGTVQYPRDYLRRAQEIIKRHGGLLIIDEVQTGFGRTGKFWGFQNHNIMPDIVTLAKGIGNGFPLAAVITTKEISDHLNKALFFNTFGGNPLACAAGSAVLDVIDEEKLMENSHHVGTYLLHSLAKLRKRYDIVGDVRGKGLMIGVEMVSDKESKNPLPPDEMSSIFEDTKEMSLLVGRGGIDGNIFRIKPPMCITRADADFCVSVLDAAISNHYKK